MRLDVSEKAKGQIEWYGPMNAGEIGTTAVRVAGRLPAAREVAMALQQGAKKCPESKRLAPAPGRSMRDGQEVSWRSLADYAAGSKCLLA